MAGIKEFTTREQSVVSAGFVFTSISQVFNKSSIKKSRPKT
jgi:hypothetical protein